MKTNQKLISMTPSRWQCQCVENGHGASRNQTPRDPLGRLQGAISLDLDCLGLLEPAVADLYGFLDLFSCEGRTIDHEAFDAYDDKHGPDCEEK